MLLGIASNNIWLGTQESHQGVLEMMKARESGQLISMMIDNPELKAMSRHEDDEEYNIGSRLLEVREGVAIINIQGGLVPSYAWYNEWFGIVSYEEIKEALFTAATDDNVKKVLIVVDSGGGAVTGLDEMAEYIAHINKFVKPVEGHTASGAYSAGYWLLSATSRISAAKMAGTGSIGVIMTTVSYADALEKAGVEYTYIRSGDHKALGQVGEKLSEEAKAELQDFVMQLYGFFEAHVLKNRGSLAQQHLAEWNTGKTFLPKKSLAMGLIDEINSFNGHVAKLFENSNNVYLSTETGLSKEAIMNIKSLNKEQQAKLASGIPLASLGLTAEELATAEAELAALAEGGEVEATETDVETEATEEGGEVEAGEGETEVVAEDDPQSSTEATLLAANADLNKQIARLEIKLEQADEAATASTEQIEALQASEKNLVTIVAEATNKLQVSLGAQATSFEGLDATAAIAQHTAAKEKFDATFKIGATSEATVTDRDNQASLQPKNSINKVN